jgi:hypothetical protein
LTRSGAELQAILDLKPDPKYADALKERRVIRFFDPIKEQSGFGIVDRTIRKDHTAHADQLIHVAGRHATVRGHAPPDVDAASLLAIRPPRTWALLDRIDHCLSMFGLERRENSLDDAQLTALLLS